LLSFIGGLGIVIGILQIFFPDAVLALKPSGVRTREAVKNGGYITVLVGALFIVFDLFVI
jgi:cytochrome c biogenesis protein CcdA